MDNNLKINRTPMSQYIIKYSPYIIFFCLILFLHFFMGFYRDDSTYRLALSQRSLIDYLIYRYNTWTSRVCIESALALLTRQNMLIWSILDSLIFTAGVYYVIKIVNKKNNKNIVLLGILLFLMYPLVDMSTAGWMASTVNYLWTFSLGVVSFLPLINKSYNENTTLPGYLLAVIALIFATNQEQACALILGFNLLYLFSSVINKRGISKYNIFAIIISILALIFFITCPGTSLRLAAEIPKWYPTFGSLGIVDKLYLGTIPTFNLILINKTIILLFYGLLNICAFLKTNNKYFKILTGFNIGFIISITLIKPLTYVAFSGLEQTFVIFGLHEIPNMASEPALTAIAISLYLILSSCYLLYKTFDNNLFPPLIFLAGFVSRLIVGFSPTIFASSSRTALYFYMLLIMLILMLVKQLYEEYDLNEKWEIIITAIFLLCAVLNYISVFILLNSTVS